MKEKYKGQIEKLSERPSSTGAKPILFAIILAMVAKTGYLKSWAKR